MLHHWSCGNDDSPTSKIACSSEIHLFEIGKPFIDLLGFRICEEQANLAFYLLRLIERMSLWSMSV